MNRKVVGVVFSGVVAVVAIDDFVNFKKISNPVNNEIVGNKENKLKTTMIATRLFLFLNLSSSSISENIHLLNSP